MKRRQVISLMVFVLLAVLTCGCTSQEGEPTQPPPSPTTVVADDPQAPSPVPTEELETAVVEQVPVSEPAESDALSPEEGEPEADAAAAPINAEEGPVTFKSDALHGELTASGVPYDKDALMGAHKDLPFGTMVTVTNLANGKSIVVEITDRLPPQVTAIVDISSAAAAAIEMIDAGIVDGRIEW